MAEHLLGIDFEYDIKTGKVTSLSTNVKREKVVELLTDFIRDQMGRGVDASSPHEKDVYSIKIRVDLTDDHFTAQSDCGKLGLRDGIIMDAIRQLEAGDWPPEKVGENG